MLKVKKQGCLLEFNDLDPSQNGLAIEYHDQSKDLFKGTTFCPFEKEKNDFSQN